MAKERSSKMSVRAATLAFGLTWGLYMLFLGWAAALGWGAGLVGPIAFLYIGFAPSFIGGIIGALWGFADGAIAGALVALLYNAFAK